MSYLIAEGVGIGMPDEAKAAGVALSEFRLLAVERRIDASEERLRMIEMDQSSMKTSLASVDSKLDDIDGKVEALHSDRFKSLWGFVVTIGAVVVTFILDHFVAWGASH